MTAAGSAMAAGVEVHHTAQADSQFSAGNFDEARALYQSVASSSPDHEAALRRVGAIALYENRLDDAEHQLKLALVIDPSDAKAESLLAECASRRGDFTAAAVWLTKAGRLERAGAFSAFGQSMPYRVTSPATDARITFVQTDPLPAVQAKVNGVDGLFLIDTGANEVVLDPAYASAVGITANGGGSGTFAGGKTASIAYGRIPKFSLSSLNVVDVPATLLGTKGFSDAAHGKPVAGVIGTAFLSRFLATIDYPQGALSLEPRDASPPDGGSVVAIPFWLVGDHIIAAHGTLNGGGEQLFFVDSGLAGAAFTAPASTLRDARIAIPVLGAGPSPSDVGQSAAAPFAIDALSLGDLHEKNLTDLYGPFPSPLENGLGVHLGGIISHGFFRPYAVTFDFARMKIYVRKPQA
jgi:tetratricopeptide (TPR) repeat protein